MIEWKEIAIGELGKVVTGKTPPTGEREYFDGEYLFVSPKDMDFDSRYIVKTATMVTGKAIAKFKNQVLPKHAVMFTSLSYGFGKIGLSSSYCLTNQQINSIIVNENHDHNFIYYLLRNNKDRLLSYNAGIVTPIIPKSLFEKVKVWIPENKKAETRIGQILSAYDDLIENNLKRIKLLEELAQRTYEEWFVRFRVNGELLPIDESTGLPVGWEKRKLTNVADITFGFPFKGNDFNQDGKGTPIIRIRNIPVSDTQDYTTEIADEKYRIRAGDLLVGMDGEFYINNWHGEDAYLVQRSCKISTKDKLYDAYIGQAIVKPIKFYEATISGATVAHLGKKHLDEIEIVMPDVSFETELQFLNNLLKQKITLGTQNRKLKESRDILLPRLMNGTIKV